MSVTERDVTVMHAELKADCRRVHKLIVVRKIAAPHRLEEMNHLRLLEKLAALRGSYGFDRCDVRRGQWQPWSHGHVCLGNDPKHSLIDVDSDCQRPATPHKTT